MVAMFSAGRGGARYFDWTEAFAKFGFGDGDGLVSTWRVEEVLNQTGYSVEVASWGMHNTVISSILKDGVEMIPYENPAFDFGYDNPREYFPEELVTALDAALPPSANYRYPW